MKTTFYLSLILLFSQTLCGGEGIQVVSGPKIGERVHVFSPYHGNGPHAKKRRSLTQCYTRRPYVMIWARSMSDELVDLLKSLDIAAANYHYHKNDNLRYGRSNGLGSCLILMKRVERKAVDYWVPKLSKLAAKEQLRFVILTVTGFESEYLEKKYNLHKEAEITVLLVCDRTIHARCGFRKGEFDSRSKMQILNDVRKVLPRLKQK